MDEAAARLRLEMNSVPEEIDEVERTITRLEIEREAVRRDGDKIKDHELNQKSLPKSRRRRNELKAAWKSEKEMIEKIQDKKEIGRISAIRG